jgi:ABC-2 type transport system ATP-binding protein
MTSAIRTERLGRDHGSVRALDALDLDVPVGSTVGLLGPNGAGKTTTMLLLATLLAPTRGRASLFGHDVTTQRADARRRLGLVFQEPSVDGLLTVEENLRFAGSLQGLGGSALAVAVRETMTRMGLEARAGARAATLSGGWRRLLDIARATLHAPALLILDEPTVALDPEHRDRLWAFLATEREARGTTVLFSTHYLAEAESADRVVLLAEGRVVGDGTPAALCAAVGDVVAELEGPGAEALATALADERLVRTELRGTRGLRLGLGCAREQAAHRLADAQGLTKLMLRPPTLEDVYFLHTRAAA